LTRGLCEELLATMRAMGGVNPFRMSGVFGTEVTTVGDEAPHVRLAGFLGRDLNLLRPAMRLGSRVVTSVY
jgi:hypothetical protein